MRIHFIAIAATALVSVSAEAGLVNRFTFDNPLAGDATRETDLGSDATPINLFNGATRTAGGAFPGSAFALKTGPIADPPTNNDHKAGIFFPNGSSAPNASTLLGTANVTGITIMGWFKPTAAPAGTTSMIGLLIGDSGIAPNPHNGRALFEIENNRLIALGRRLDASSTRPVITSTGTIDQILPVNEWTHIAATFDYDLGSIVVYRNGTLLPMGTTSYSAWALTAGVDRTSNTAAAGIKIGGQVDDDTTPFTGFIDEVRIYNESLPATGANSIQSVYASMVPEPALAGTFLIGCIGLLRRRT